MTVTRLDGRLRCTVAVLRYFGVHATARQAQSGLDVFGLLRQAGFNVKAYQFLGESPTIADFCRLHPESRWYLYCEEHALAWDGPRQVLVDTAQCSLEDC